MHLINGCQNGPKIEFGPFSIINRILFKEVTYSEARVFEFAGAIIWFAFRLQTEFTHLWCFCWTLDRKYFVENELAWQITVHSYEYVKMLKLI